MGKEVDDKIKKLIKEHGGIEVQEKSEMEHHLFHIGETLANTEDMMNNRLSEIHSELKSIEQALWHIVDEIKRVRP